jgi:multidrug efflux pump subunit AcrB
MILTLEDIATKVGATSVEIPGGQLKTEAGEILVRFDERREWAKEFADIPILTTPKGSVLLLSDIATVSEGFEDTNNIGTYNGKRAMGVQVYRVGEETPIGVAEAARGAMKTICAGPSRGCAVRHPPRPI